MPADSELFGVTSGLVKGGGLSLQLGKLRLIRSPVPGRGLLPALVFLHWQLKYWLGQSWASWVMLWQGILFTV